MKQIQSIKTKNIETLVEDLPPLVDEIDFLDDENTNKRNKFVQRDTNILIFVDLKQFGIQELKAEIIDMSQIIIEFIKTICSKYFLYIDFHNVQMMTNGWLVDYNMRFNHYDISSNSVFQFIKFYPKISNEQFYITIHIHDYLLKRQYDSYVHSSMKVSEVMEQLFDYLLVDKRCRDFMVDVIFEGKMLKDESLLYEYNIKNNSRLDVQIRRLGGCFPGNAPIKLFNGTTKIIKDIEVGDIVQCYDFEQQQFKQSIVVVKQTSTEKQLLIEIITQNGRIVCTPNHPVYTQNGWKAFQPHPNLSIEKLSINDLLFDSNGKFVNIVQINFIKEAETVYNITTKYPNNFIAFDFFVHNMNILQVEINGQIVQMEIEISCLISEIKDAFNQLLKIPVQNLQLYYKGILMKDKFSLEDYHVQFNGKGGEDDPLILKVIKQSEGDQQEIYQNNNFENIFKIKLIKKGIQQIDGFCDDKIISITSKKLNYKLNIKKNQKINIRQLLGTFESKEDIERSLILCDGAVINSSSLDYDIQELDAQSIILIDQQQFGGIAIKFTLEINDQQVENISQLKDSLQWLCNSEINEFIQESLEEINANQQRKQYYQKIPLHCIIALRLNTSNLIYRELNNDLRTSDYQNWKKYLKCLMEGLRYMQFYRGVAYRGIKNYQNTQEYQKGKTIQWSGVSSISLNYQIAENFSNNKGMIFQVDFISAKNIENISIFEREQELIMYPFSAFVINEVQDNLNKPIFVTMTELPLPRSYQVLLWVDDNPQKNYKFAEDLEILNSKISVIFCTTTKDAIRIIKKYRWMIYLTSSQFRVVSNLARIEEGKMNYNAGIELLCHLYQQMKYKNQSLIFSDDFQRVKEELNKLKFQGNFEITNDVQVLFKFLKFE
ncbi:unnamed protein product [Paramecium sonneborni]|uniref:NAD(P)(+)--arginine ADP-ribosyltransferase n=1 Tax=Paramecium sonneborni TaxID=65129 RepID=A0A8S1MGT4_9CILI|nr:unnamed protein product [Paramecium sonneborni]